MKSQTPDRPVRSLLPKLFRARAFFMRRCYSSSMSDESDPDRLAAARRRVEEIGVELPAIATDPTKYADFFRLCRELPEMGLILGELSADEADEWARQLDEQEQKIADSIKLLQNLSREPTPEEHALIVFTQRLVARQGTIPPDFDALYRRNAELDRKLSGIDHHGPAP